jgi:hypothetical protein
VRSLDYLKVLTDTWAVRRNLRAGKYQLSNFT